MFYTYCWSMLLSKRFLWQLHLEQFLIFTHYSFFFVKEQAPFLDNNVASPNGYQVPEPATISNTASGSYVLLLMRINAPQIIECYC
jgi:hypothetical protein